MVDFPSFFFFFLILEGFLYQKELKRSAVFKWFVLLFMFPRKVFLRNIAIYAAGAANQIYNYLRLRLVLSLMDFKVGFVVSNVY